MLSHVVLLKPRASLTEAERRALTDALKVAVRDIPTIKAARIGRRVVHGATYESTALDTADYVVILDFDDLAGLRAYLDHPAHAALGTGFAQFLASALVYDFETGGLGLLDTILSETRDPD
jgi:hypothetical protein